MSLPHALHRTAELLQFPLAHVIPPITRRSLYQRVVSACILTNSRQTSSTRIPPTTRAMPTSSVGLVRSRKNSTDAETVKTSSIWPTATTWPAFSMATAVNPPADAALPDPPPPPSHTPQR